MWDEEDGFFYDVLHMPDDGKHIPLKVRSMVGLIPLFAVETLDSESASTAARIQTPHGLVHRESARPDLQRRLHGQRRRRRTAPAVAIVNADQLRRMLACHAR